MVFYGLVSWQTHSVIEFFSSADEAEAEIANVAGDEPDLASTLSVVEIDLGLDSRNN